MSSCHAVWSQNFQRLNAPVNIGDGMVLPNPWAGGLNAPQWSKADLNNDGKQDIYIFDRNGDIHLAFANVGGPGESKYQFAPDLVANFPASRFFVLLRDFNHDGAVDLFASSMDEGVPGMRVFRGKFENNKLVFNKVSFPWIFDVLIVPAGGDYANLLVNSPDYPAIDDIDNDGDLDVLALNASGNKVDFYCNQALEQGYNTDTLIFINCDNCWGKFSVEPFAESFTLSSDPSDCVFLLENGTSLDSARHGLHGGATLCTFDENNDGDKEILYGDLIYPHVIQGKNGGTPSNGWINSQDSTFPSYDLPVNIPDFAATYYLDLDNDGANDLIASPNLYKNSFDLNVGWFYKNTQTNEMPVFELQNDQFLVEGMIDLGTSAYPTFADVNADGLIDLVVGNETFWVPNFGVDSRLFLYLNIGTATEPVFELADDNWLDFQQFMQASNAPFAFAPNFGDLDNDGDQDLVVGERYGSIFLVENLGGAGQPFDPGTIQIQWKGINVGQYATPFIYDLNGDGLSDLLIGERNGTINYLPNTGSAGNPAFQPDPDLAPNNKFLGKISTQTPASVTGFTYPWVLDFEDTAYIVTGGVDGYIHMYLVDPDSINGGAFPKIDGSLGGLRQGFNSTVAFANLNGDNLLDAVIGNLRGGLGLFTSPIALDGSVPVREKNRPTVGFEVFPSPAGDFFFVKLEKNTAEQGHYRLFNSLGQPVATGQLLGQTHQIEVAGLSPGFYFIEVEIGGASATKRLVVR